MYSKIKKTVFTTQFYVFILLGGSVLINACQEQESAQPQFEEVQYEMYDDQFVTVVLDPNKVHEFHSFTSLEEHDNYLLAMEESEEKVVVNKKMYEDLSHYFDPYMLSVMDMNYEIEVAGERFKADREAIYKKTVQSADWELYVFYGLSGKVDLEEVSVIHQNILELNKLSNYEFKSPSAEEVYQRRLEEAKGMSEGRVSSTNYALKYALNNSGNANYEFAYKNFVGGDTLHAHMRLYLWNEKYKKWGKKARGGTFFQINKYEENSNVWVDMQPGQTIGDFHENGIADTSAPYTKVQVVTTAASNADEEEDWKAYVNGVNRNTSVTFSYHWAKVRENNSNVTKRTVANQYYVQ